MWIIFERRGDIVDRFDTFNDFMVNLYNEIMTIEEKAVITEEFKDISNNDMHVIEAIGDGKPKNMSTVAKALKVTVGTLTIAINSLVKKGYVKRVRSEKDRRVVLISLLIKGKKAFAHHRDFHEKMISAMLEGLSNSETEVLVKALTNLKEYFLSYSKEE
jgi:Transcriptional regulators